MEPKAKLVSAVTKLNRLTQEGQLKWKPMDPPAVLTEGTDSKVHIVYVTKYKATNLRIYESRHIALDDYEQQYWSTTVVLEVFDDAHRSLWRSPLVAGLWDLLEAVKYQTANIDTFLDDFLKEG